MPVDPQQEAVQRAGSFEQQILSRVAALEERVQRLEVAGRIVYAGSGAPTFAAPDGALYVDVVGFRLYGRASSQWRYVALIT